MTASRPVIVVHEVSRRFAGMEKPALDSVSCKMYPGGITGLVGPDGAGKTTLLRHLAGLLWADSGSVSVAGFDARTRADKIHPLIGYMPQKFGLYEELSVSENLRLYADLRNVTGREREESFTRLLAFTGLAAFQSRPAGKLSGGMRQKLGLACSLLGKPKVLLLDEPGVGVDPLSRRELRAMVQGLLSDGLTVVWSTSYLDEAETCDAVILLNEGRILYDGLPDDMLHNVRGRIWQLDGVPPGARRGLLLRLLTGKNVADAVIQGRSIRMVTKTAEEPKNADSPDPMERSDAGPEREEGGEKTGQGIWRRTDARFEDAFIDKLGGGPGGFSALGDEIAEKTWTDKPVIDARNLCKRFGDFIAVRDSTFQIRRGEVFGLLGPNGAGKSTIFKMMCGLLRPTSGSATVMGLAFDRSSPLARSRIGYMAQKFSLYGALSVFQNLRFFSGAYGLSGKTRTKRIDMMVSLFNLKKYLGMSAETLSLGYKQRLALACSVMHQPDVLFLDEPTSGVDPVTRREFWLHINAMVQKGVTVMVTTHFMDEAEYCDRIALIYRGESIAVGAPDDLKDRVRGSELPDPSLEDAFISLIRESESGSGAAP